MTTKIDYTQEVLSILYEEVLKGKTSTLTSKKAGRLTTGRFLQYDFTEKEVEDSTFLCIFEGRKDVLLMTKKDGVFACSNKEFAEDLMFKAKKL